MPRDPTRPITTFKTAWRTVRAKAGVKGRWHDNRRTPITDLAESGAGDQTIMDIAGHVSKQMLKHCSHIRMEAKRQALESITRRRPALPESEASATSREGKTVGYSQSEQRLKRDANGGLAHDTSCSQLPADSQGFDVGYPQSGVFKGSGGTLDRRKSLNINGGRGRNRTYNLSVKSRRICRPSRRYRLL